jgi:putative PEP-CTERM system histidine kinase
MVTQFFLGLRLTMAVSGLVLVHNLYVNTDPLGRSGVRLLAIGLGGFFLYDLNFFTLAFLLPPPSSDLFNIRGAVDTITVPLLLLSTREAWVARVQVSRRVVFHTLSFSMIGFYLIAMALLAYGLRLVGGDWGRLLQISFLFTTVILGAVVLVSPRFRAALRVQIAQNFFAYKYDYRVEWLRFIATVSRTESGAGALHERVIQAVCAVVDSPGGVLFVPDEEALQPLAAWNSRAIATAPLPRASAFARHLEGGQRIIDFDELRAGQGDYGDIDLPDWARADTRIWLGIPLVHLDSFAGFLVLERTLAPRALNWEDYDLLRTLGARRCRQVRRIQPSFRLHHARHQEPGQPIVAGRAQCRTPCRQPGVPRRHGGHAAKLGRQDERHAGASVAAPDRAVGPEPYPDRHRRPAGTGRRHQAPRASAVDFAQHRVR